MIPSVCGIDRAPAISDLQAWQLRPNTHSEQPPGIRLVQPRRARRVPTHAHRSAQTGQKTAFRSSAHALKACGTPNTQSPKKRAELHSTPKDSPSWRLCATPEIGERAVCRSSARLELPIIARHWDHPNPQIPAAGKLFLNAHGPATLALRPVVSPVRLLTGASPRGEIGCLAPPSSPSSGLSVNPQARNRAIRSGRETPYLRCRRSNRGATIS